MGAPGLFLLAFLDSAFAATGGGPDVMILVLATRGRETAGLLLFALAAVLGSTLGCLVLYAVGLRGGRTVLSRFSLEKQELIKEKLERYGLWAIAFSVMAPPPYPMKLFVLSAGVFGMSLKGFVSGVLLGRAVRYLIVGCLAVQYGDQAAALLRTHFPAAAGILAALVVFFLVVRGWRRRRPAASGEEVAARYPGRRNAAGLV
jgi:undecaprenyl-diphosphatase